ncbi:MAG: NYN domain-containing protein [Saprospiraceae bacterium]|nr:NYN domain-containing protein [Saprospiraceae bacterium]
MNLAVLIDGDNIPSQQVKEMMEEIAKYGNPTIKRIYGDWTNPHLARWKKLLLENAITPIQQYSYTTGKNATDSAMIIDAMDILYSNKVEGFCIVSSDSDFTKLATRLREAGMLVIGIGEKKTPQPFIVACDRFIYLEILALKSEADEVDSDKEDHPATERYEQLSSKEIRLISESISDAAEEDGWAFLGDVGSLISKRRPNFDSRTYGFAKLTPLMKSLKQVDIDERDTSHGRRKLIYVRIKEKRKAGKRRSASKKR